MRRIRMKRKKSLEIQQAAKIAFIGVLGLIAGVALVLFIVSVARADYPNGFDKIHAICANSPEVQPGLKGVELSIKDESPSNRNGMILLFAGEGDKGIGVGAAVLDSEGNPIVYIGIYHMSEDDSTIVVNILTGEEDTIEPETIQKFITWWLGMYDRCQI
jgi:hypothetical protein